MRNKLIIRPHKRINVLLSILFIFILLIIFFVYNTPKKKPPKPTFIKLKASAPNKTKAPPILFDSNKTLNQLIDNEIRKNHIQLIHLQLSDNLLFQFKSNYLELQHFIKLLKTIKLSCPAKLNIEQSNNSSLLLNTLTCNDTLD